MRGSHRLRENPSSAPHLTVSEIDRAGDSFDALLSDFGEGGLVMDCPRYFAPNATVQIEGNLKIGSDSVHLVSRARVVFCRRVDGLSHRIGVEFLDAEYRPVIG